MADKGLTTEQLDAMDNSQLSKELEKAKAELFNLRFAQADATSIRFCSAIPHWM